MVEDTAPPTPQQQAALYRRLADATPEGRARLVLQLIDDHPEGRLVLPSIGGEVAVLEEVDLSPTALAALRGADASASRVVAGVRLRRAVLEEANLRGANLRMADLESAHLRGADLRGAILGGARLRSALLEEVRAENADLAGVDLLRAALGGADLRGAMLEEVQARGAALRFARLDGSVMEDADLRDADLWGATLNGAMMQGANLQNARFHEASLVGANLSRVDLRGADLRDADLRGCVLHGADLRGALVSGCILDDADLREARLQGLDLTVCAIRHVKLSGAWLEKSRLDRRQLGDALGEERAENYDAARYGYLALERNFEMIGDPEAASWAYRRKRRMQKQQAWVEARQAFRARRWGVAARRALSYVRDQFVEWLCDYGESVPRTLAALLMLYLLFMMLYGVTGSVVRVVDGSQVGLDTAGDLVDLAIFSLISMTSSEGPAVGLEPVNQGVHVLTGLQALLSIAMTGLLGFVLGNRIRR